jgi:hypothetical protein
MTCKCHNKKSSLARQLENGMAEGAGWALAALVIVLIIGRKV